jgi:hypothetical protein
MPGIPFDPTSPSVPDVRRIVLERLRRDSTWKTLDNDGLGFDPYVEYKGDVQRGRAAVVLYAREVFWQLVCEGVLSPGMNSSNLDLPWFRITDYGRKVLQEGPAQPHDPTGYLDALRRRISNPDPTVLAYIGESLETFRRGSIVASAIMLGVAAERVFDLVCESLLKALANPSEKKAFEDLLQRYAMKPKLEWVAAKLQALQRTKRPGFPDNAPMMVTVIYDLLRSQRNELGHPREIPPEIDREEEHANLQIFPTYYETAERLRSFLQANSV